MPARPLLSPPPRRSPWLLALPVLLAPTTALRAAPDQVAAVDLGRDVRVAPHGSAALDDLADAPDPAAQAYGDVIFLNYGGAQLTQNNNYNDDARTDTSWICGGSFPAWGTNDTKKQAILQAFNKDWEAYNVLITTTRPASGNYTMTMIGPGSSLCDGGGDGSGVAPIDCENEEKNSVVFGFTSANSNTNANGEATLYSQEIAHSYGLEHVTMQADIMNPSYNGSDQSFRNECYNITGGVQCDDQHQAHCGSSSQQNSHAELLAILGSAAADIAAPEVMIVSPQDGATYQEGDDFTISVDASDDKGVTEVRLYRDGVYANALDTSAPYGWGVNDIPAGSYAFQVIAYDAAGNEGMSNVVGVDVEPAPDPTTGTTSTTGGGTTSTTGGGTTSTTGGGTTSTTGGGTTSTTGGGTTSTTGGGTTTGGTTTGGTTTGGTTTGTTSGTTTGGTGTTSTTGATGTTGGSTTTSGTGGTTTDGSGGDEGRDSGDDDGDEDPTGFSSSGYDPGAGPEERQACACAAEPGTDPLAAMLALPLSLLGFRRRR